MESYVEITFMHNLLISAFSLTSSLVLSRKPMNRSHFWKILLMVTILPSFLFCENSMTWIWLNEIIMFLFLFKERNHTYLLFVTFRLLFHLIYYMLFEGVIYHLQFFVSDIFMVFLADMVVGFFYLILLSKGRYHLSERDFLYCFEMNHKKYRGYVDSGNLATYRSLPIIFVKRSIYETIKAPATLILIEQVVGIEEVEGIKSEIIMNRKKIQVICCPLEGDYPYDALLNMKGIL
ncbi:hypothetical protein [uncultured Traorella sp.]|uniref:hypothetical protein n=1 Tax=uncultured Traorella sp. TaxID=1929048 RepID=UPI0025FDEA98|nr:hypothetical protein [uncultured Traorella sp.]